MVKRFCIYRRDLKGKVQTPGYQGSREAPREEREASQTGRCDLLMDQQLGMGADEAKQNKIAPRFSTDYGLLKQVGEDRWRTEF